MLEIQPIHNVRVSYYYCSSAMCVQSACAGLFKRRRCGSHLGGKICTSLTYYACAIQQKLIRGAAHARSTIYIYLRRQRAPGQIVLSPTHPLAPFALCNTGTHVINMRNYTNKNIKFNTIMTILCSHFFFPLSSQSPFLSHM